MFRVVDIFVRTFDINLFLCIFEWRIMELSFSTNFFSHSIMCDDNLLLSKLYLHRIYYNVIRQNPSHDTLFN